MSSFGKYIEDNIGLTIGIMLLIIMMALCHYAKWNFMDKFQNVKQSTLPANRINYYATPDCKDQTLSCPGQHPMIPCSLIKKCPGSTSGYENLKEEDKRIVDMYMYLMTLLKSVDVYKFPDDDYWFKM